MAVLCCAPNVGTIMYVRAGVKFKVVSAGTTYSVDEYK